MSPSPNSNVTPRTGFCMDLVLLWFFVSTIYIYTVRKFCIQAQHYRLKLYYVFRHKLKKTTKTTKFRLFWYPIYISIRHSNATKYLHRVFCTSVLFIWNLSTFLLVTVCVLSSWIKKRWKLKSKLKEIKQKYLETFSTQHLHSSANISIITYFYSFLHLFSNY